MHGINNHVKPSMNKQADSYVKYGFSTKGRY
ncbi:MAG: hypothetical protein ACD_8C00078G0002 [uncultured bacterium]|nr:MAG: hypothetical protein ACD_8C00078G0002 [uncultured bacterium]